MDGLDLRLAVSHGLLVLPVRGSRAVELTGKVLRYDPTIRLEDRRPLVLRALRNYFSLRSLAGSLRF